MEELIKITKKEDGSKLVSAKELHTFLEVSTERVLWFKRMMEYGFEEGKDFVTLKNENPVTKQVTVRDYALSLDCAKEVSMIQRTDKGKQARQYFIECEKKLSEVSLPKQITYSEALRQLADKIESEEKAKKELAETKPKVEFFDQVASSTDTIAIGEVAKILGLGMGQNKLFAFLRDNKVLMWNNLPYQYYIDLGWFKVIEVPDKRPDGTVKIYKKTTVFQKGVEGIMRKVKASLEPKEQDPEPLSNSHLEYFTDQNNPNLQ